MVKFQLFAQTEATASKQLQNSFKHRFRLRQIWKARVFPAIVRAPVLSLGNFQKHTWQQDPCSPMLHYCLCSPKTRGNVLHLRCNFVPSQEQLCKEFTSVKSCFVFFFLSFCLSFCHALSTCWAPHLFLLSSRSPLGFKEKVWRWMITLLIWLHSPRVQTKHDISTCTQLTSLDRIWWFPSWFSHGFHLETVSSARQASLAYPQSMSLYVFAQLKPWKMKLCWNSC